MDKPGTSKDSKSGANSKERRFKPNHKGSKRFKPYFGSQNEGQGFADVRKKKVAREYLKFLQKEQRNDESTGKDVQKTPLRLYDILARSDKPKSKSGSGHHLQKIAEEKQKRQDEEKEKFLKEKEAKDTAIKSYKAKKKERFLKLCKKTRKGQPVMKNQMEVLLEKIMKHKGKEKRPDDAADG